MTAFTRTSPSDAKSVHWFPPLSVYGHYFQPIQSILRLLSAFSLLCTLSAGAQASTELTINDTLPAIVLESGGEVVLENDKAVFKPWSSESLAGKLTFLQVIIATNEAAELNDRFLKTLEERKYVDEGLHTANIIVSKKIPGPFRGFVKSNLKKNKWKYPRSTIVEDRKAISWDSWTNKDTLATVMLIDKDQQLLFYKQGKLSDQESEAFYELVENYLAESLAAQ